MRDDDSPLCVWTIILTVAVMLLIFYPLSMGPMFRICSDASGRVGHDFQSQAFLVAYRPVIWVMQEGPQPFRGAVGRYFEFWEK